MHNHNGPYSVFLNRLALLPRMTENDTIVEIISTGTRVAPGTGPTLILTLCPATTFAVERYEVMCR
jgi:hypothetical protein